jgi:hypothetical protein
MTSQKIRNITAVVALVNCVALAISIILSIWFEFTNEIILKSIGTCFVLLLLSGFIHAVAQGMVEAENEK